MPNKVPHGWSLVMATQDRSRAEERARGLRKDGATVKVAVDHTHTLGGGRGGRGIPVTDYLVLRKNK